MLLLPWLLAGAHAHEIEIRVTVAKVELVQTLDLDEDGHRSGRFNTRTKRGENRGLRYVADRVTGEDGTEAYTLEVYGLVGDDETWLAGPLTVAMLAEEPGKFAVPLGVEDWSGGLWITFTP